MRGGASLPLHPFLVEIIQYFNIASFQFTPKSFHIMVAFHIAFMEAGIGEPSVVEFAYVYGIKALAKNVSFWCTTKRGPDVEGI